MALRSLQILAPSAYSLGGVADWLDYTLAGLSASGIGCHLSLVEGGGHDVGRYLARHPWQGATVVSNPTGSREGRIRALMNAILRSGAELVVSVNLVDVYEAVRRLRASSGGDGPRVAMALHGLQADLISDICSEADVLDGVVVTNRLSVALAVEALSDPTRVHYAPYGVAFVEGVRRSVDWPERPRLLYAGRIEQDQKRVMDLPRILGLLHQSGCNARLSIAGGGPLEAELRHALDDSGLSDSVDWLGDLDAPRLAEAYRTHDALLITSVWETGPIVAWEAMSHALPVVSSRYVGSGLEGALIDGVTALLFGIGDVNGAVAAILRLGEPGVREAIVSGGQTLVKERYSRKVSVAAWNLALDAVNAAPRKRTVSPRLSVPSGRLDRWLGVTNAETVRRFFGRRFSHGNPGAAWPHTRCTKADQESFLKAALAVDVAGALDQSEVTSS